MLGIKSTRRKGKVDRDAGKQQRIDRFLSYDAKKVMKIHVNASGKAENDQYWRICP